MTSWREQAELWGAFSQIVESVDEAVIRIMAGESGLLCSPTTYRALEEMGDDGIQERYLVLLKEIAGLPPSSLSDRRDESST